MNSVTRAVNIEDLRRLAKRRLPRVVFDYIDGGSGAEVHDARELRAPSRRMTFRARNAVARMECRLQTTVLGDADSSCRFYSRRSAAAAMFFPRGECVAAAEAGKAGTIYTLSTLSGCALEDVKAAATGPVWYQLYLLGGRDAAVGAIARARAAGYRALVVTVDTAVAGQRERDVRNGGAELVSGNLLRMLPHVPQLLARPRWLLDFLRDGGMMKFPNVIVPGEGVMAYEDVAAALERSTVSWDDMAWIRDAWRGPIVIKGVLSAEDARRSLDVGAEAIVVSNHGGRQLDYVSATLRALARGGRSRRRARRRCCSTAGSAAAATW